jgi:nicotinate-nucleotide--dimethylbenzimidazole phosphoribosyltransferase
MRAETMALLDDLRAPAIAFSAGVLLSAAARRTACIVDGTDEHAAALVADRMSTRAKAWWTSGSQSSDLARQAAVDRIGLRQGLPLALSDESGWGARATIAMVRLATGATLDE